MYMCIYICTGVYIYVFPSVAFLAPEAIHVLTSSLVLQFIQGMWQAELLGLLSAREAVQIVFLLFTMAPQQYGSQIDQKSMDNAQKLDQAAANLCMKADNDVKHEDSASADADNDVMQEDSASADAYTDVMQGDSACADADNDVVQRRKVDSPQHFQTGRSHDPCQE